MMNRESDITFDIELIELLTSENRLIIIQNSKYIKLAVILYFIVIVHFEDDVCIFFSTTEIVSFM